VISDADAMDLAATDVDLDGHKDIVSLGNTRGATIFYGDGHGGFRQTQHLTTNARGSNDLKAGDLTGDGIDDLAVMSGNYGAYVAIHRHNGVGGYFGYDVYGRPDTLFGGVAHDIRARHLTGYHFHLCHHRRRVIAGHSWRAA